MQNEIKFYEEELRQANNQLANFQFEMEEELLKLQLSNATKLVREKEKLESAGLAKIAQLGLLYDKDDLKRAKEAIKAKLDAEVKANKKTRADADAQFKQEMAQLDKKYEKEKKLGDKIREHARKEEEKAQNKARYQENVATLTNQLKQGNMKDKATAVANNFKDNGFTAGMANLTGALASLTKDLEKTIDTIAGKKGIIDTALQGSNNQRRLGSYWDQIVNDVNKVAGISPLVKQSAYIGNIEAMVTSGIAYNVEQRAFLETIKDKIAATFDANNATLSRLIRIQQQDSTASRLGMESAITSFLNSMYENTEYLRQVSTSVKSSLEEAMSLMSAVDAVGFEYQVQKWMGSMYSVGMSQSAVQNIANAFGNLTAGNISGISGGGVGNLLIMAANRAGLSIGDILAKGLDESDTNKLFAAMTSYLAQVASDSSSSKVLQQQLASIYGLSASDLKAAINLSKTAGTVGQSSLNYAGGLAQLSNMVGSMYSRTSIGEMGANLWDNFQYGLAGNIAGNLPLYALLKTANLLDSVVGGIDFSIPMVLGSGTAQTFNVADIMRTGALSGSILVGLAHLLTGGMGGLSPIGMLKTLGIPTVSRGGSITSGTGISESGYVGNGAGGDVYNKTMTETTDSTKKSVIEAKESEQAEVNNKTINDNIVNIYNLLVRLTNGSEKLYVMTGTDAINSFGGGRF